MKVWTGIFVGALLGLAALYAMLRWFHPDEEA